MDAVPERQKVVIHNRHVYIAGYIPDFLAYGDQGFWGYVVYDFTDKDIFVFESNRPDNATYIFRGIWKEASKLTKAEILGNNLQTVCPIRPMETDILPSPSIMSRLFPAGEFSSVFLPFGTFSFL